MEEIEKADEMEVYKKAGRDLRVEKGCVTRTYLKERLGVHQKEVRDFFVRHPEMIEALDVVPDHWGPYLTAAYRVSSRSELTYEELGKELGKPARVLIQAMSRNKELRKRIPLIKRSKWDDYEPEPGSTDSPDDKAWLEYFDAADAIRAEGQDVKIESIARKTGRPRWMVEAYFDRIEGAKKELGVKD